MNDEIIRIDLEDELDLHHFDPKDAKDVLLEFIEIASDKGKKQIRIIHGKGISTLKTIVYKALEQDSRIQSFNNDGSNWGATVAILKNHS
jgi:DNA-nicking Smr family endonuclease